MLLVALARSAPSLPCWLRDLRVLLAFLHTPWHQFLTLPPPPSLLFGGCRHYDYGENLPQSVTYEVYADGRKVQRNLTGTKKHNTIFRPTLELVIEDGNHADRVIAVHSHKSVLLVRTAGCACVCVRVCVRF